MSTRLQCALVLTCGLISLGTAQAAKEPGKVPAYVRSPGILNVDKLVSYRHDDQGKRETDPSKIIKKLLPKYEEKMVTDKVNPKRLHHIAFAVPSVAKNVKANPGHSFTIEPVESQKVVVGMEGWPEVLLGADLFPLYELLESRGNQPLADYLGKQPQDIGLVLHHLAWEVGDTNDALGIYAIDERINEKARRGFGNEWVGFIKPKAAGGVLTEFVSPGH